MFYKFFGVMILFLFLVFCDYDFYGILCDVYDKSGD